MASIFIKQMREDQAAVKDTLKNLSEEFRDIKEKYAEVNEQMSEVTKRMEENIERTLQLGDYLKEWKEGDKNRWKEQEKKIITLRVELEKFKQKCAEEYKENNDLEKSHSMIQKVEEDVVIVKQQAKDLKKEVRKLQQQQQQLQQQQQQQQQQQ